MNYVQFQQWLPSLLEGLKITLLASAISIFTSIVWGSIVSILSSLGSRILSGVMRVYTSIFRNTPLLVIMFFCFYGLPLMGVSMPALVCGILAITLNEGAFVAEILRGAVKNLPAGEIEAAYSLGLSRFSVVTRIVFPLAIRNSVPMLTGQASIMVKDTSLFSLIMIVDITRAGSMFYDKYLSSVSIWIVAAIYVAIFLLITQLGKFVEKKSLVAR
ncbi:MAG TPA: amino acid ABC transporter permease [Eubacteriales bacterium]|nr:amino acid ABC transporter permease [Clostridia bacterium]HRV73373.1 amino acid ABC transporter permease [Eubacteriales bacterium]